MPPSPNPETNQPQIDLEYSSHINSSDDRKSKTEKILCPHCQRTATNGIKCQGICVADSGY
jgi:hypothetical protein